MKSEKLEIKIYKLIIISSLCMLVFSTPARSQDALFSLFESNAMNFNPAHVGNEDFSRLSIGYRNDYPTYKSPFATYMASYDMYVDNINSGFGIMVMNDNVGKGIYKTTSISAGYSYNLQIGENMFLRGGLSCSYFNRKRDPNGLIFPDMPYFNGNLAYVATYKAETTSTIYVGAGITFMYKRFKMGGAVMNFGGKGLASSSVIKLPKPLKATGYMTVDIPIVQKIEGRRYVQKDVITVSPYVRYLKQYEFEDLDIGAYVNLPLFFVGIAHRSDTGFKNSTFVIGAGFRTKYFNIGYSANFGDLGSERRYVSAHEVNLTIKFPYNRDSGGLQGIYLNRETSDSQRNRTYKCPY